MSYSNAIISEDHQRTIIEKKLTYILIIRNFDCINTYYVPESIRCKKFEFIFGPDLKMNGKFTFYGNGCGSRKVNFSLQSSSSEEWDLSVKIYAGSIIKDYNQSSLASTGYADWFFSVAGKPCPLSQSNNTIRFEISYVRSINVQNVLPPIKATESDNDFVELFQSKKFWDVTLIVSGREVRAHKCILAGRSKVFAAMFEHDLEETKSNKVIINDIDVNVFIEMLRYIYTNEVVGLQTIADSLLAASDKYYLSQLKVMCENELVNNLSIDTAAEILMQADLYNAEELKERTVNFIKNNLKTIAKTDGWKQIQNNHPHLLAEICLHIAK